MLLPPEFDTLILHSNGSRRDIPPAPYSKKRRRSAPGADAARKSQLGGALRLGYPMRRRPQPSQGPAARPRGGGLPISRNEGVFHGKDRTQHSLRRFCESGAGHPADLHRRLRPCGRDGRHVRPQHHHRHSGGQVAAAHHHTAHGRSSDDCAAGAVCGAVL